MRLPLLLLLGSALLPAAARAEPIAIPVLVIATYETGQDRGDVPGELQFWAENEAFDQSYTVPGVEHPLLANRQGLFAMVSGTSSRCALQIMALAADPRFDLRKTYFVLCGIGGGDPSAISLGSAVWVDTAVDGNPAFEIDSREIPQGWPYGLVAIGATEPNKGSADVDAVPAAGASEYGTGGIGRVAFHLNPSLVRWAYGLTKDLALPNSPAMNRFARRFKDTPKAYEPPAVVIGDSMGGDRFFHGALMTRWAEDWVRIYTRGKGSLAISDCEDAGACLAFQHLSQMGKADFNRLIILRTACNFVVPPSGDTAVQSLFGDTISDSSGVAYVPALECAYRVGHVVTAALLKDREKYRDRLPE